MSPEALKRAQERFAIRFRKAVLERIEREREERVNAMTGADVNRARDNVIRTMKAAGYSFVAITRATEARPSDVRATLDLAREETGPLARHDRQR